MTTALLTRQNVIEHAGRRLASRSPHLLRVLAYLWWKRLRQPAAAWVGVDELSRVIDAPSPKLMQRLVDRLAAARLPLLDFRHKTVGPWRLAMSPAKVMVDRDELELVDWLGFQPLTPSVGSLDRLCLNELAENLRAVVHSDAMVIEQGFEGQSATERWLAAYRRMQSCASAPVALRAAISLRLCLLHRQRNDFAAWERELRDLAALAQPGERLPADFAARLHLQWALLHFDRCQTVRAWHRLERIDAGEIHDVFTLGRFFNARGLIALQLLRHEAPPARGASKAWAAESEARLTAILADFRLAIGYALAVNDYVALEGICYNLGCALRWAARQGPTAAAADLRLTEAADWLILCETICLRFGVGNGAQWSRLALVDIALQLGWTMDELQRRSQGALVGFSTVQELLLAILANCVERQSRLEQAETCRLLWRDHADYPKVNCFYDEAERLYRELGRQDKIAELQRAAAV